MTLPRTPSLRLDHRRAFVTGAGRGIGMAAAAALAQAGAHVVLAARTEVEIEAVAGQIRDDGGSAEPLALDVTNLAAVHWGVGPPAQQGASPSGGVIRPADAAKNGGIA